MKLNETITDTSGVAPCRVDQFSSRCCELGTKGCTVTHGVLAPDVHTRGATHPCDLGVGCDEAGVCYAEAHGQPEQCPHSSAGVPASQAPSYGELTEALRRARRAMASSPEHHAEVDALLARIDGVALLRATDWDFREQVGRMVREEWMRWAREQPNPKPSWLAPWEDLSEPDREVDRRIGEVIWKAAAPGVASSPAQSHTDALRTLVSALREGGNASRIGLAATVALQAAEHALGVNVGRGGEQ